MRKFCLILAALMLGACGAPRQETAQGDCSMETSREIAWAEGDARLGVVTRAEGESCAAANVTLDLRNAEGRTLHSVQSSYHALTIGGDAPASAAPVSREAVETFLTQWSDIAPIRTGALPAWRAGASQPGAPDALPYRSPQDRAAYEALRAANAPALCIAVRVDTVECFAVSETGAQLLLGYAE